MKTLVLALCAALLLWSCGAKSDNKKTDDATTGGTDTKTETKTDNPAPVLDSATKMKNWMDYSTVSDVHKMIAKWDGKWASDITFFMPGAPEMKMAGTAENTMVNEGFVQQSTHTGTMMGRPFKGMSLMGYDNHRKVFWNLWMDNFGSGNMYLEGTWDETAKSINLKGKTTDPETKQQIDVREVMMIVDDNTQKMEQYMSHDGKEFKSMDITFRRSK
jgi:hypothetical protein